MRHSTSSPLSAQVFAHGRTSQKVVALTFDDGPSPYSSVILETLRRFGARATFFLVGKHVSTFPATVRTETADGNELGNHTFDHLDVAWYSSAVVVSELSRTQDVIRAAVGFKPHWFRPPYGAINPRVSQIAASLGLRSVLWDVDPADWARPGVGAIANRVLAHLTPGSIVLMHDGGGDRSETVAALPIILATLKAQGYRFVTLDTLFNEAPPHPCDLAAAARWFANDTVAALPTHQIYALWQGMYCDGRNLGPATSREFRLDRLTVGQDFATTGHRILWNQETGTARVIEVWGWPVRRFSDRGVAPAWHTAITTSWFAQYFQGRDWGSALDQPRKRGVVVVQHFQYGKARASGGQVTWAR